MVGIRKDIIELYTHNLSVCSNYSFIKSIFDIENINIYGYETSDFFQEITWLCFQ